MLSQANPTLNISLTAKSDHFCGRFNAMASPCELLIDTQDAVLAEQLTQLACQEALRIEHKYSRYRQDNWLAQLHRSNGQHVALADETYRLLCFADSCYQLSDGMFDLTSGVLRRAWRFDGSANVPDAAQVAALLPLIGWQKVSYDADKITLPEGMELDLGGIGKEYAVDCVARLCQQFAPGVSVLVNFGGDIQVSRPRDNQRSWHVGIESLKGDAEAVQILKIQAGGLATSGDARRFLLKDGVRYSHILNPFNGYPVADAPRSVTVLAGHCIQAGLLATLALLQGAEAEAFLQQQGVRFWCYR